MIGASVQKVIQQNRSTAAGAARYEGQACMRAANVGSKERTALPIRLHGSALKRIGNCRRFHRGAVRHELRRW